MKQVMLIKYLQFLKKECLRHQNDEIITDDEKNQLQIEINNFLLKLESSILPNNIKDEVLKIDFNLSEENHNKSKFKWLNFIGGFLGRETKTQANRKHRFKKLYNDLDTTLFKIKTLI